VQEIEMLHTLPFHNKNIYNLTNKYISYSEATRLAKKWFYSHNFSEYINEEVIELLVAYTYVSPSPYNAPLTSFASFRRLIHLLASHNWETTPLYININENKSERKKNILKIFESFDIKIPMFILESYNDEDLPIWTRNRPNKMILNRLTMIAKQTEDYLSSNIIDSELFVSSSFGFDIVIEKKKINYEELMVDFEPMKYIIQYLKDRYGKYLLFFYDKLNYSRLLLAINPAFFEEVDFNMNSNALISIDGESYKINIDEFKNDLSEICDGVGDVKYLNNLLGK
jgi:hypothetical protein